MVTLLPKRAICPSKPVPIRSRTCSHTWSRTKPRDAEGRTQDDLRANHRGRRRYAGRHRERFLRDCSEVRARGSSSGSMSTSATSQRRKGSRSPKPGYRQSAARLTGAVTLFRRNPATFGEDIRKLNTGAIPLRRRWARTTTPDGKQRIKNVSRDCSDAQGDQW